jgi:hypothetical protein
MIRKLTLLDALLVVDRMRPMDWEGVHALAGPITSEAFALSRHQTEGPAWTLVDHRGVPQAIFGLTLQSAWSAVAWLVCAEMTSALWKELIRFARIVRNNVCNPEHEGYRHRVYATVLASWDAAKQFAHSLGGEYEGTQRSAGFNGEDFETWAIVGPVKGTA